LGPILLASCRGPFPDNLMLVLGKKKIGGHEPPRVKKTSTLLVGGGGGDSIPGRWGGENWSAGIRAVPLGPFWGNTKKGHKGVVGARQAPPNCITPFPGQWRSGTNPSLGTFRNRLLGGFFRWGWDGEKKKQTRSGEKLGLCFPVGPFLWGCQKKRSEMGPERETGVQGERG